MGPFYLEIHEEGERLRSGDVNGYETFDRAKGEALRRVDDALPNNYVHVFLDVGDSSLGGDGGSYFTNRNLESVLNVLASTIHNVAQGEENLDARRRIRSKFIKDLLGLVEESTVEEVEQIRNRIIAPLVRYLEAQV